MVYRSHKQGKTQDEMSRQKLIAERRMAEIENLAIAKQQKDAECVDLVNQLESLTAEMSQTRE